MGSMGRTGLRGFQTCVTQPLLLTDGMRGLAPEAMN